MASFVAERIIAAMTMTPVIKPRTPAIFPRTIIAAQIGSIATRKTARLFGVVKVELISLL